MIQTSSGKNLTNAITVGINDVTLEAYGENTLYFSKVISRKGNNLIIDNGKIKIGKDINHILISGSVQMQIKTVGTKNIMIYKNNECVNRSLNSANINKSANAAIHVTPVLINAKEGDLISMSIYGSVGDILNPAANGTHLTLIAI